ncbi:MAG: hypothetical protein AB8F95_18290 [Bacteroidia bacterium]
MGNVQTQNLGSSHGVYENRRVINNKKFHAQYEEVVIDRTVDDVWNEVSGNFVNAGEVAKSINEAYCLSGDVTEGLGAERYMNINFQGRELEVKERIIDFKGTGDHREFTYDVYESKGSPLKIKTYNTWIVRKGNDGKTYLGTVFIFRASPSFLTGIVGRKLRQSGSLRNGVLTYKHYLETGEKNVDSARLNSLYPYLKKKG